MQTANGKADLDIIKSCMANRKKTCVETTDESSNMRPLWSHD